jgi:hypothetical protein
MKFRTAVIPEIRDCPSSINIIPYNILKKLAEAIILSTFSFNFFGPNGWTRCRTKDRID